MLSWGALVAARENGGPTSGAAGLLLSASRGLFPLSVGSYTRLLASLVHSQVHCRVHTLRRFCVVIQQYCCVFCFVLLVPGVESKPPLSAVGTGVFLGGGGGCTRCDAMPPCLSYPVSYCLVVVGMVWYGMYGIVCRGCQ